VSNAKPMHHTRSPMLTMLIAIALSPMTVNAEVLSITPIGADAYSRGLFANGYQDLLLTHNTSTVLADSDAQWISVDIGTGTIKYVIHVNTTPSGVPLLETAGNINTQAKGGLFYQLSNVGNTTLTLPKGSVQLSLSSQSGIRRLPSTNAGYVSGEIMAFHAEGMMFGLTKEVANGDFAGYVDSLVANKTMPELALLASGAMNEMARYAPASQASTQDDSFIVDDASQGLVGVELKPGEVHMGEVTNSAIEHAISLSLTLSNALDITIAPGTSRLFGAQVESLAWIFPNGQSNETDFPFLFKDASHSAKLGLLLPESITVQGAEALPWVITQVPEPTSPALLLGGLTTLLWMRWQGRRRG
jgi:hypothetical protein